MDRDPVDVFRCTYLICRPFEGALCRYSLLFGCERRVMAAMKCDLSRGFSRGGVGGNAMQARGPEVWIVSNCF